MPLSLSIAPTMGIELEASFGGDVCRLVYASGQSSTE